MPCPSSSEAKDHSSKTQNTSNFGFARAHGNVHKVSAMRKRAEHDHEDDEGGDPGPELERVDDLVAEQSDEESAESYYEDTSPAGNGGVDGVDELSSDDDVN